MPAGEEVQYRRAAGGGAQQLLRGVIASDGMITCYCDRCKGAARQPNSIFEEHAGSKVGMVYLGLGHAACLWQLSLRAYR